MLFVFSIPKFFVRVAKLEGRDRAAYSECESRLTRFTKAQLMVFLEGLGGNLADVSIQREPGAITGTALI